MSTALLMMYDGGVPFGPTVEAINRNYAMAVGAEFVCYHSAPDPNFDPYWNRLRIIQQELGRFDVIWWLDADAFFLRQTVHLPVFTHDIAMSADWNGICCGVMAVRNTAWVHNLLDAWLLLGNVRGDRIGGFDNGQFREQTTLKAMCYFWPLVECHITRISEAIVQAPTSKFEPEALILHMWSSWIGGDRVFKTLDKFQKDGSYNPQTLHRPDPS